MSLRIAGILFIVFALVVLWFRAAITGKSITKQWSPAILAVFLSWNVLVPLVFWSATYHGKVVDEETDEPIPGAVVAVIWYHSPIIQMEHTRSFQAAQETVTDADGMFSLWTWPKIDFNPFTYVDNPPDAIIYKAGYVPLAPGTIVGNDYSFEGLADALKKGIVVKLPKLKTKEETRHFANLASLPDFPNERLPNLVHQVNIHRKSLGIASLYPESGK